MKITFLFISVLVFTTNLFAKPRPVFLDTELKSAKFVGVVIIDNYDTSGNIHFHSIEFADTITKAFANFKGPGGTVSSYNLDKSNMTGYWPFKTDTFLIVIDSRNRVSLFAEIQRDRYRFWSPYFTLSVACFYFNPPAYGLGPGKEIKEDFKQADGKTYHSCWDGCYLNKQDLRKLTR